jgi:hypothetical protein
VQDRVKEIFAYHLNPAASELNLEDRTIALLLLLARGLNTEATKAFFSDTSFSKSDRKVVANALNENLLIDKGLEWTNHGPRPTFRFWTSTQKTTYLQEALSLVEDLKKFTPHVCFGFGAILGMVRDADFIPHDDDLDLLIAMEPKNFPLAKEKLKNYLADCGYTCHGKNYSHFGVNRGQGPAIDVFIGFREDEHVSWFPSRRWSLQWDNVFPVKEVDFFGEAIPVPRDIETYLEATYGEDWRKPDSAWGHPWNINEYQDFMTLPLDSSSAGRG